MCASGFLTKEACHLFISAALAPPGGRLIAAFIPAWSFSYAYYTLPSMGQLQLPHDREQFTHLSCQAL